VAALRIALMPRLLAYDGCSPVSTVTGYLLSRNSPKMRVKSNECRRGHLTSILGHAEPGTCGLGIGSSLPAQIQQSYRCGTRTGGFRRSFFARRA
jgi:hypothetical protein